MAAPFRSLSSQIPLLLFLIASLQVHATREGNSFTKIVDPPNAAKEADRVSSSAAPESVQGSPAEIDPYGYNQHNKNGYGLYARGNADQPSRSTTTNSGRNALERYGFHTESFPAEDSAAAAAGAGERNYKDEEFSEYPSNGFGRRRQHPQQQQGMSDTRFLENGRYYYDIDAEDDQYAYGGSRHQPDRISRQRQRRRYGPFYVRSVNRMDGQYKNREYYSVNDNQNANGYGTSMEGYGSSHAEEEEFIP